MNRIWMIGAGALLGACITSTPPSVERTESLVIELDKTVHFLSGDGQDAALTAGTYRVEAKDEQSLNVTDLESGKTVTLQAVSGTHDDPALSVRVVSTIAEAEDLYHVVLLMPRGKTLDAIGSFSGVRTRGPSMMPLQPQQMTGILSMVQPQFLKSPAPLPGPPPLPSGVQPLPQQFQTQPFAPPGQPLPPQQTGPQLDPCTQMVQQGAVPITLVAQPRGPFSVQLSWTGPPGDYAVSTTGEGSGFRAAIQHPVQQATIKMLGSSAVIQQQSALSSGQSAVVQSQPAPEQAVVTHEPTLPDFPYSYRIEATLKDGRKACGKTSARTAQAPPITGLSGRYVNINDIRLGFLLPPYVRQAKIYQNNAVVFDIKKPTGDLMSGKDPQLIPEVLMTRPGLPPLPNDYTRPVVYSFTVEAIWTMYKDGSGPVRTVRVPISVPGPQPIWGFADTHAHQFANLGFGGLFVWGKVWDPAGIQMALPWCEYWPAEWPLPPGAQRPSHLLHKPFEPSRFAVHGAGGTLDAMGSLIADPSPGPLGLGHRVGGHDLYDGWPRWNSVTHQMMYYEWLYRAFLGGLRLMVMHAVNSETLCSKIYRIYGCNDMEAVDRQLQAARDLEAFIDARSGGPGKGWYRIVRSPQEARQAIANNQMAIVLGIEVPDLFGCAKNPMCTQEYVTSKLQYYYDKGVRHMFPIHSLDNAFGGTAFFQDMYRISQWTLTGREFKPYDCSSEGIEFRFDPAAAQNLFAGLFSGVIFLELPGQGHCNSKGLTGLRPAEPGPGAFVLAEMMKRHMIIDIDHMSRKTAEDVLRIAEANRYPVISGHAGIFETSLGKTKRHEAQKNGAQIQKIGQLGGMVGVITAQGAVGHPGHQVAGDLGAIASVLTGQALLGQKDGVIAHGSKVRNDCSNSSKTFAQAYLFTVDKLAVAGGNRNAIAVALGTDMQGAIVQPGPRFGNEGCSGAMDQNTEKASQAFRSMVTYPFQYGRMAQPMGRQQIGRRVLDINTDGVANVGMLPDFIADLYQIGLNDDDLKPLFQSAEGYIRMWERASYVAQ